MGYRHHLSPFPDVVLQPVARPDDIKPGGFWYGVNLDWIRWLMDQGYEDDSSWMHPFLYEIEIDESRVLKIATQQEFADLNRDYDQRADWIGYGKHHVLDWVRLKQGFAGLEISPYRHEVMGSLDCFWYHGWDCASGVVWDVSAITGLRLIADSQEQIIQLYRQVAETREEHSYG